MKNKIKVIHVPEICKYNEFISRTEEIQENSNIEVLKPNICIDGDDDGTKNLKDVLKYTNSVNERVVVHFHWPEKLYKDLDYETFKDTILKLKDNNIKLVKTIHNLTPHEVIAEDKKKEDLLIENLDGIILFSKSQLKTYQKVKKYNGKATVIPHPNYKVEENIKEDKPNQDFVLCIPGRIRKYKQTDIILRVLELLKDYNVKVVIVGKPDDLESVERLKKYSNDNLKYNFNFVSSKELEKYIFDSDMVLLTHKYIWTSGIAILTANLGTTLIGTLPKIFEEFDSNQIGYFLKSGEDMTAEKMADLIKKAISEGKEEVYIKGNTLKKILNKNNDELIGNLYKRFYEELFQ